ncbi:MAG TPA: 30S ribosomal protein S6 [Spirochaetota bacterium]|nr:30S ribosomal protein S6 [Spirochaetota bacterium]HRZ28246.1 30S ribosomal protein S6 [Spirochaetota bacterium]HSA13828.1 30S ribosomal protein S6 [Spirochaetota bacterium]
MINYELTVLLRPKTSETILVKVREILQKFNVKINEEPAGWGQKRLAYEIDGEREAYYFFALIEATPDSVSKIISEFRLIHDILRFLFVKIEKAKSA